MDGSGDKRKLTELKVDGIILWPNLNAAAANSLLILRFHIKTSARNVKKIKGCNVAFIGCVLVVCGFTTDVWINGWTDG